MRTINFANTQVSQIAMGTAMMDRPAFKDTFFQMLDLYYEAGGTFFDTARCYCCWMDPQVWAEEHLGAWLKERNLQNKVYVSTKGAHPNWDSMDIPRVNKKGIFQDMETSLNLLKLDHVDLYFLHRDDVNTPVEEIMPALHELVTSGKTSNLGASNWSTSRIAQANAFAIKNNLTPFCTSQIFFSIATTTPTLYGDSSLVCMDAPEYNWYMQNQMPVMAFSAQAKGFFSKLLAGAPLSVKADVRFNTPENIQRAKIINEICDQIGSTPSAVALAALMSNPLPTIPILGASKPAQIKEALGACSAKITSQQVRKLFDEDYIF